MINVDYPASRTGVSYIIHDGWRHNIAIAYSIIINYHWVLILDCKSLRKIYFFNFIFKVKCHDKMMGESKQDKDISCLKK